MLIGQSVLWKEKSFWLSLRQCWELMAEWLAYGLWVIFAGHHRVFFRPSPNFINVWRILFDISHLTMRGTTAIPRLPSLLLFFSCLVVRGILPLSVPSHGQLIPLHTVIFQTGFFVTVLIYILQVNMQKMIAAFISDVKGFFLAIVSRIHSWVTYWCASK